MGILSVLLEKLRKNGKADSPREKESGDIIDMASLAAFGSIPDGETVEETLKKLKGDL
jgi:hypothetical protein